MKKLIQKGILGILLVLAIFMSIPIQARADDGIVVEKDGDFLYRVEGESDTPEVTIYSYVGSDTDVTVPSEIKGMPVTTLHGTFSSKETVKKVTVPEGVRLIEYNAFYGCTALTTVVLPSSLEEMTEYTFYQCTNLKTVSLDTANSKLTKIGRYSFAYCEKLTGFDIPSSLKELEEGVFFRCSSLKKIIIPDTVEKIDRSAFYECTNVIEIKIPGTVKEASDIALVGCEKVITAELPISMVTLANLQRSDDLETLVIVDDGSTELPDKDALNEKKKLKKVVFPDSLTSIPRAFCRSVSALEEVKLPANLKIISNASFSECTNLKTIDLPDTVTEIGAFAFADCTSLKDFTIPDGIKSIGEEAFYNSGITSLVVPESVETIDKLAFSHMANLVSATIPAGYGITFNGYTSLKTAKITGNPTAIDDSMFRKCSSLVSIELPDTVTEIGKYAFADCTSLKDFTIPDGIKSIGEAAFYNSGITSLVVPESVETIDKLAFSHMANLVSATIPAGYGITFNGCTSLKTAKITGNLTAIDDWMFNNCGQLSDFDIPDSVTRIGYSAFSGTALKEAVIPAGVTEIDDWAFGECQNLEKAMLPDGLKSIGEAAFYECPELTDSNIPDSVTTLGGYAFSCCPKLKDMTIPDTIDNFGECVFEDTPGVTIDTSRKYFIPTVDGIKDLSYTGSEITQPDMEITVNGMTLKEDSDYEVSYSSNTEIGTATMDINFKGQYVGHLTRTFNVVQIEMSDENITVTGIHNTRYTGKKIVMSKLAVQAGGRTLTPGTDYTVAYKNNLNPGTAEITIAGKGNYTGTVVKTFNILILKGSTYTVGTMKYKVTNAATNGKGTVAIMGTVKAKTDRTFTSLSVPSAVKIGGITYNVTMVNVGAFSGYTYLKKVVIGNGIKAIGSNAFYGCKSIASIIIGRGVTAIGGKTFYGCSKLASISVLSSSIKLIGKETFTRIAAKPVVVVPKAKLAKYKQLMKNAGMTTKAVYRVR